MDIVKAGATKTASQQARASKQGSRQATPQVGIAEEKKHATAKHAYTGLNRFRKESRTLTAKIALVPVLVCKTIKVRRFAQKGIYLSLPKMP